LNDEQIKLIKKILIEKILSFDANEIHECCVSLGLSCDWESFENELNNYNECEMLNLLIELYENR